MNFVWFFPRKVVSATLLGDRGEIFIMRLKGVSSEVQCSCNPLCNKDHCAIKKMDIDIQSAARNGDLTALRTAIARGEEVNGVNKVHRMIVGVSVPPTY